MISRALADVGHRDDNLLAIRMYMKVSRYALGHSAQVREEKSEPVQLFF